MDMDGVLDTTEVTVDTSATISTGAAATIAATAHGFSVGDVVTAAWNSSCWVYIWHIIYCKAVASKLIYPFNNNKCCSNIWW